MVDSSEMCYYRETTKEIWHIFLQVHRALTVEDFGGPVSGVIATYWSPVAQLRNLEETVACVLQLLNQEPAREATTVDLPPSYNGKNNLF